MIPVTVFVLNHVHAYLKDEPISGHNQDTAPLSQIERLYHLRGMARMLWNEQPPLIHHMKHHNPNNDIYSTQKWNFWRV